MRIIAILLTLVLTLPCFAFAATGALKGTLHKNSANGSDLSGVKVKCGGKSDTTDKNGKFKIEKIATGNQSVSFSKDGYESFQSSVQIVSGKTANMGDRWLAEIKPTTGSVSGRIHKNSASGAVLSGVAVSCGGKNDSTDGNGNFKLAGIAVGDHSANFSKQGYESFHTNIKVVSGQNANLGDRWLAEKAGTPVTQPPSNTSQGNGINLKSTAYTSENPFAKAGYGGQCTAFAWGRALEVTGKKLDTTKNGKLWYDITKYPKGQTPKAKSIAVWGGDSKNRYGHVAFVESVDNNGNVTINEANFRKYKPTNFGGGYDGSPLTLTQKQMSNRSGAGKLLGYIYLVDSSSNADMPVTGSVSSTGSVSGRFHKNSASGDVLSGVAVSCAGKSTTTDGSGNFKLEGINAGDYVIALSKQGYEPHQQNIKVVAGQKANMGERWLVEINPSTGSAKPRIKFFSQVNQAWSSKKIGKTESTIGGLGCALVSKAMVFSPYNATDPVKLNDCLTSSSGYSDDLMKWDNTCVPKGLSYKKITNSHESILSALNNSSPVIVRVYNKYISSHYIVIFGHQNGNYIFKDPLDPYDNNYTWPKGYVKEPYTAILGKDVHSYSN